MLDALPLLALLGIFAAAAGAVWLAGIKLSDTTDILATRFGLGQALGGVILLAVATNLPEIAITVSAAASNNIGVAVGNIVGGIAVRTVVLVILDVFGMRGNAPLMYKAASLTLVAEGLLVVAVLIVSIMGTRCRLPQSLRGSTPVAVLITVIWIVGVWLIGVANRGLPWHDKAGDAPDTQDKPKGHSQCEKNDKADRSGVSTARAIFVFLVAEVITLVAGVVLKRSGEAIATHIGITGVLSGATVLAAATSLPEVSTGLASAKAEGYQLAVSDIFGGNAFLPVLFLLATVVSGKAVLPRALKTDIYLVGLGVLLTSVYLAGLIFRQKRRVLAMGIDSLTVLVFYILGTCGLFAIALADAS